MNQSYKNAREHYEKCLTAFKDARSNQDRKLQSRVDRVQAQQKAHVDLHDAKEKFKSAAGTPGEDQAYKAVLAAEQRVADATRMIQLLGGEDIPTPEREGEAMGLALNEFARRIGAVELEAMPPEAMKVLARAYACWSGGFFTGGWPTFLSAVAFPNPPGDLSRIRLETLAKHGVVQQ